MGAFDNFILLGDSPVLETGREDLLEYGATAKVLATAAIKTKDPFTIGVFGKWGTGKTSLMRLIQQEVKKNDQTAAVWFNAWQYEKEEHLIVPLVATINKELDRNWKAEIVEGAKSLRDALRAIAYGFSVKGKVGIPLISEAEVNLSGKDMIARYQELTKDSVLDRSLYFDAFEALKKCVKTSAAPRIVIFVDDLDRCLPDKAVQLLEGIKLILHQPGFSFVLGLNEVIIEAYIKTKYEKELKLEGTHYDDYLDKMVQVKIPVPERDTTEMTKYIKRLLDEGRVFQGNDQTAFIPLIADACDHNPRSVVRLLNRIMVTSKIGEIEGKPYDPEGLLLDIATDKPRYHDFREALDITIIIQGTLDEQMTIGEFLAKTLFDSAQKSRYEWSNDIRDISLRSMQDVFSRAADVIKENEHLFQLLKSNVGRAWLSNSTLRSTLRKAVESTRPEKRSEEEPLPTAKLELADPIQALLKNMVPISGGTFDMGSEDYDSEKPVHKVLLSAFEIGATQVTQAQYEAVMKNNPSEFKHPDNPVEMVSWKEAMAFCGELSKLTGKKYILPTEAQWEYACRAGSNTRFCFGNEEDTLEEYAWYGKNSEGQTHPVGRKKPNNWGLYDMHGNVWEWCRDWYGQYPETEQTDPEGPASGPGRVLRGASWDYSTGYCRSAARNYGTPDDRNYGLGFRVVRIP